MSQAHKNISRDIQLVTYKNNEIIYKQGDFGNSFFYILSGTIDVFVTKRNNEASELLSLNGSEKEVI